MTRHSLYALTGAFFLAATTAQAGDIDHILNNTVQLTANVGEQSVTTTLLYQADGTIQNAAGESSGTWEIAGDELCTTLSAPGGQGMQTACSPLAAVKATNVGDTWSFSPGGVTLDGILVAGR